MQISALRENAVSKCLSALEQEGFRRFEKDAVDWPLSAEFNAWVGLNVALKSDRVHINPFVGVHVPRIMKMSADLSASKYVRSYATYSDPLGRIAPDELAFEFTADINVEAEADRLAKLYRTIGLDFARSIGSYEVLLPILRARVDVLGGYPERVACCLRLMGLEDEAERFVRDFCSKEPEYFGVFANAFLQARVTSPN